MTLVILATAALVGSLLCALRWWRPALAPLPGVEADQPPTEERRWDGAIARDPVRRLEVALGAQARSVVTGLGLATPAKPSADLAIAEVGTDEHLGTKIALAILGPAIVVAPRLGIGMVEGDFSAGGLGLPCVVAALIGYALPDIRLRRVAGARRAELAAVVGVVARLARIAVAGGDGVESAIRRATAFGEGWAHVTLRNALADQHGRPAEHALAAVGDRFRVPEARQLADALNVARQNGAPLLGALAASARGIHRDRLNAAEAAEARKSVLLSLPVGLMVLGFMVVLIGGFVAQTLLLLSR